MKKSDEEEVRRLLKSWDLDDGTIEKFISEDVTVSNLKFLSEETLKELIPKSGPRDAFIFRSKQQRSSILLENDATDEAADEPQAKRSRSDPEKAYLDQILAKPDVNDLHKHLKTTIPGLTVLGFDTKNGYLDNYSRDILCEQVIYKALEGDYNKSLTRSDFKKISDSICTLFPNESEATWFDVVKKGNSSVVEGRLRFKFYNVRQCLYKSNLISRKTLERDLEIEATSSLQDEDVRQLDGLSTLDESSPWDVIQEVWESSRKVRLLFSETVEIAVYLGKFPILQHPNGWLLIAEDGIASQPCLKHMHTLWDQFAKFVVEVQRKTSKRFLVEDPAVDPGEEDKIADYRFLAIISKLPNLFKVRTLPKSSKASKADKACYRPSMQEVRDAFCLCVTDIALLDEKLNQRRNKLAKYKFSLQAVPVIIGTPQKIKQCFIVLDTCRWEVDSPATALWGVMKICFGLNASYPVEARHLYLFLQQCMLKLELPLDYSHDKGLRSFIAARTKEYNQFILNDD